MGSSKLNKPLLAQPSRSRGPQQIPTRILVSISVFLFSYCSYPILHADRKTILADVWDMNDCDMRHQNHSGPGQISQPTPSPYNYSQAGYTTTPPPQTANILYMAFWYLDILYYMLTIASLCLPIYTAYTQHLAVQILSSSSSHDPESGPQPSPPTTNNHQLILHRARTLTFFLTPLSILLPFYVLPHELATSALSSQIPLFLAKLISGIIALLLWFSTLCLVGAWFEILRRSSTVVTTPSSPKSELENASGFWMRLYLRCLFTVYLVDPKDDGARYEDETPATTIYDAGVLTPDTESEDASVSSDGVAAEGDGVEEIEHEQEQQQHQETGTETETETEEQDVPLQPLYGPEGRL